MMMTNRFPTPKRITAVLASTAVLALSLWPVPTLADDPFRDSQPREIGDKTEAAFKAIFEKGNYPEAKRYLQEAESSEANEPLVYAMRASFAYTDWEGEKDKTKKQAFLEEFKLYADKTLQVAEQLRSTDKDPLRGNLYTAVGHFLQGAHGLAATNNDPIKGGPQALSKLQQVFSYLDKAEAEAPQDKELQLLKGYMELMIAVNLPFSNPTQAIEKLEKAGPRYLAVRGIALGYRDLKQYDKAMDYVNQSLKLTDENPEVHYLKAQILVKQAEKAKSTTLFEDAKKHFNRALANPEQLPKSLVGQIFYEQCKNQKRLDNKGYNCDALRDQIRKSAGSWGPAKLPPLE